MMIYKLFMVWGVLNLLGSIDAEVYASFAIIASKVSDVFGIILSALCVIYLVCQSYSTPSRKKE